MSDTFDNLDQILEAALFTAGEPLTTERLQSMFPYAGRPKLKEIESALERIEMTCHERGVELLQVATGYRFQAKAEYASFIHKLWEKKPPKYSRALLETLALVVYRQPITRGEIEEVRGVAVSTNITKTLQDRDWIKVVGTRDVPGKPALFGTTKQFLDDFNLTTLSELPPLQAILDIETLEKKLGMQFDLPPESLDGTNASSDALSEDESEPESEAACLEQETEDSAFSEADTAHDVAEPNTTKGELESITT